MKTPFSEPHELHGSARDSDSDDAVLARLGKKQVLRVGTSKALMEDSVTDSISGTLGWCRCSDSAVRFSSLGRDSHGMSNDTITYKSQY